MTGSRTTRTGWNIAPGHEIVPGRIAQSILGGGDRFEVYAAWNERLMAPTVLKVLRPPLAADDRARRAMIREGNMLAGLGHPGLARLLAMEAHGARPFVELEHVEGPRLSTMIRRHGRLDPEQAFPLGRAVAATLAYLHAQGFLHLDVKPSNIIMGSIPRLIDLSVARRIDRAHRIKGLVGTDAYMSPEQADPSLWPNIGPKSDTWALGATLYYAVAKRRPHSTGRRDASGPARFPQLVESPAPLDPIRHCPPLVDLIMDSLARSPEARPNASELFDRLDELAERAGVRNVPFGQPGSVRFAEP